MDSDGSEQPTRPGWRFQLVVFDLDGTLIDSRLDLANAVNLLLTQCGAKALDIDAVGTMIGDGAAVLIARAFAASGIPEPDDSMKRFLEIYGEHLLDHTVPYQGMARALELLTARATLAVLTNKPLAATRRILRGLDLNRSFREDLVIGGDGAWPRKPAPDALLHLISTTGAEPATTLFVGDSPVDWRTARAAETAFAAARYGFGFRGFPPGTLDSSDRLIDRPVDLLEM